MPRTLPHRLLYRQPGHRYQFRGVAALGSADAAVGNAAVIDIFIIIVNNSVRWARPSRPSPALHPQSRASIHSEKHRFDASPQMSHSTKRECISWRMPSTPSMPKPHNCSFKTIDTIRSASHSPTETCYLSVPMTLSWELVEQA